MSASQGDQRSDPPQGRTRLESWKAVAVYLSREINTVQRWEKNEGLPIHRHVHGKGGSIYAFSDEIDEWRLKRSVGGDRGGDTTTPTVAPDPRGSGAATLHDVPANGSDTPGASLPEPSFASTTAAAQPHTGDGTRRWWKIAAAVFVGVACLAALAWWSSRRAAVVQPGVIRSVAVLPLRDLSPKAGEEYFADSMTETLIARLATSTDLKVTSRTSVMAFKQRSAPLREIADSLGVDAILEGSVTRADDRLRIIATLVDARADAQLWSGKFERPFEDVLTLQGDIADAIARAVQATVHGPQRTEAANREVSSESYRHYLKGRFLLSTNTLASIQEAIREFDAALAVDPSFAPAYAGLAASYEDMSNRNIGAPIGDGWSERSIAAARRALDLNPDMSEAHAAMGRALMAQLKWDEAEVAFRRALTLNPSDAASHIWFGQWQVLRGQTEDGLASARRAIALDPLSVRTTVLAAFTMGLAGAREEQAGHLRAALAIRPDYFQAQFLLGLNLVTEPGTRAEGVTYLEKAAELSGRTPQILAGLGRAYALSGRVDEARRLADEVLARQNEEAASPSAVALAYVLKNDREHALRALEDGFRARSRGIHQLPRTNWFKELEDDPRYRDLVKRVLAG